MKGMYECTTKQAGLNREEEMQLLNLASSGDHQAQEKILREYAHLVGFAISRYHLAGGEQDDLYQEGMIGLLKAIEVYRPDRNASFRTFSQICIRRQILTAIKRANRRKHGPLNQYVSIYKPLEESRTSLADVLPANRIFEPESVLIYQETVGKVKQTMMELTELEREVLLMHMEGIGYHQIGRTLNKDPKAVDNALQRCKRKLAKKIGGIYS